MLSLGGATILNDLYQRGWLLILLDLLILLGTNPAMDTHRVYYYRVHI